MQNFLFRLVPEQIGSRKLISKMSNNFFQFKKFKIHQSCCAMKVTTDACLFGAWATDRIQQSTIENKYCLDIGTGTGLLSLMMAQKISNLNIEAIEIDEAASEQAASNFINSPWSKNLLSVHSNIVSYTFPQQYDAIISNPPFYENELNATDNKKNIAHHSQELNLADLFAIIQFNLKSSGSFFLLLPFKRQAEIQPLLLQNNLKITHTTLVRQSTQHHYFRIMLEGTFFSNCYLTEATIAEISICDDTKQYTKEFISLLKDYYLNL